MQTSISQHWMTVRQLAETHPCFSESSLRWLIFHKERNGFKTCLRKVGRRILINLDSFEKWVESYQEGNGNV